MITIIVRDSDITVKSENIIARWLASCASCCLPSAISTRWNVALSFLVKAPSNQGHSWQRCEVDVCSFSSLIFHHRLLLIIIATSFFCSLTCCCPTVACCTLFSMMYVSVTHSSYSFSFSIYRPPT